MHIVIELVGFLMVSLRLVWNESFLLVFFLFWPQPTTTKKAVHITNTTSEKIK